MFSLLFSWDVTPLFFTELRVKRRQTPRPTIVIDSAYTKGFEEYVARSENLYVVDVRLLQTNPITFWTLLHSVCLTLLRYLAMVDSSLPGSLFV